MPALSQRQLRVGELVRHAIAQMILRGDIHNDYIARSFLTIPEVRLSPDLKIATVYVNVLNNKGIETIIKALAKEKYAIRTQIAKTLGLKFAPDLRFRPDEAIEEAGRIDKLLNLPHVKRDIDKGDRDE
jgi:ribosome-binding factor A